VAEPARRLWTLQEFLAFDDGTDKRYELFDGQIVAMAPASDVQLVARLVVRIGAGLRPPREVVIEAGIVPPERADSYYEADLAITCTRLTGQQFLTEPRLIVEVLSPSTATTDRDRKLPDYRTIPSLRDILVVSSTEPRIEHFRREPDGWKIYDLRGEGTLRIETSLSRSARPNCTPASWLPARNWSEAILARGCRDEPRPVVGGPLGPNLSCDIERDRTNAASGREVFSQTDRISRRTEELHHARSILASFGRYCVGNIEVPDIAQRREARVARQKIPTSHRGPQPSVVAILGNR
jgi:Uma2 family endonuclease